MASAATVRATRATATGDPIAALVDGFDEVGLIELLQARPDLASPAPRSRAELVERAAAVASVQAAVDRLDRFSLQVVQALAVVVSGAANRRDANVDDVYRLLGPSVEAADLDRALIGLETRALVARQGDHLHPHRHIVGMSTPAGLGPPAADLFVRCTVEKLRSVCRGLDVRLAQGVRKADIVNVITAALADGEQVRRLVARAPEPAAALARQLAAGPPEVSRTRFSSGYYPSYGPRRGATPFAWLAGHGLVVSSGWQPAVMPREVALALRGGKLFAHILPRCPPIETTAAPGDLDTSAARAASAAVAAVERIVEQWGSEPAPTLKTGGVGIRELRKLASTLERSTEDTALLVEMAGAADLVTIEHTRGRALPTPASDTWLALDPEERWVHLAAAWVRAPGFPSLAALVDRNGKPVGILYPWGALPEAAEQRQAVLATLCRLEPGTAPNAETLVTALGWQAPAAFARGPASPQIHVQWVRQEADLLGMTAGGALSGAGRAVAEGRLGEAAGELRRHTDPVATELVLQADSTAIISGQPPSTLARELGLLADVESTGAATVYRFAEGSLRRAFDAGRTEEDIISFLEAHAAKGVPQPLRYLVGDVARRFGQLRAGRAGTYVRTEDPSVATEVLRAKRTARLGLRQIAPTVLVSDSPVEPVLAALRAAGYLPAHEGADGALVRSAPERHRASARPSLHLVLAGSDPREAARDRGASEAADLVEVARHLVAAGGSAAGAARPAGMGTGGLERRRGGGGVAVGALVTGAYEPGGDEDGERDDEPGVPSRPVAIEKDLAGIASLLDLADEEGWLVRVSYSTAKRKHVEMTAGIVVCSEGVVLFERYPDGAELDVNLDRVQWARVLTEAEEDKYL